MRNAVYDEYTDEETSDCTLVKRNRYLPIRHITSPVRSSVGLQVFLVTFESFEYVSILHFVNSKKYVITSP